MSNTIVTFQWDMPEMENLVVHCFISILPEPVSHPVTNTVSSPPWNVTLEYDTDYTVMLVYVNCAGEGYPFILSGLEFSEIG